MGAAGFKCKFHTRAGLASQVVVISQNAARLKLCLSSEKLNMLSSEIKAHRPSGALHGAEFGPQRLFLNLIPGINVGSVRFCKPGIC